jgi:hypothetical protein
MICGIQENVRFQISTNDRMFTVLPMLSMLHGTKTQQISQAKVKKLSFLIKIYMPNTSTPQTFV